MKFKDIIRVSNENGDGYFYTTENMLRKNILIEEAYFHNDDLGPGLNICSNDLTLYYYDDLDAKSFTLGFNIPSSPILIFASLREIVDLFENSSLDDFLSTINDLSEGSMHSSHQTSREHRKDVYKRIVENFNEYERMLAKAN